ncbi:MAG: DUF1501 domain-containing protein, partial [Planctomycetia bacterium]|nr:DUF1501 domain-containing protein [Planctomycetia bacterium]
MHFRSAVSRRDFLAHAGGGFGAIALANLLAGQGLLAAPQKVQTASAFAPRSSHVPARARAAIFIFIDGGPSHIDLYDYKPRLNELAGQPLPPSFERPITPMGVSENPLLATKRKFQQHGESGMWVSDWLPEIARHVDDIAFIRSCKADGLNHVGSVCQMNTGSILAGRPCIGSWVTYGLGTENQDLPGFVVLLDNDREPPGGSRNWSTGFMPATFQGTRFRGLPEPILHLRPPKELSDEQQRSKLDLLKKMNREHARARAEPSELEARIAAYELAFRMQAHAPEAIDLAQETAETQSLYGLDQKPTADMARCCLMARRLVERGVRFVQIYSGSGSKWDAHSNIEGNHGGLCKASDQPVAGLLEDLKRRGLLDETLVIWGGEFGRTPMSEKGDGRDHNPYGFTMWMAGGGVQGGVSVGATDELGAEAVEDRFHVKNLHATILTLMGLDPERLSYFYG